MHKKIKINIKNKKNNCRDFLQTITSNKKKNPHT